MPQLNVIKNYSPNSYYHIYNHLVPELGMALDDGSKSYMLKLFARHLSLQPQKDQFGRPYKHLRDKIDLLSYCILDNHFHLLVYQKEPRAIEELMRSVSTSYSIFLNRHNDRRGSVFETVFKGVLIQTEPQLLHISRYIHRNPGRYYYEYEYSSYQYYSGRLEAPDWLDTKRILGLFENEKEYIAFCAEDWIEGSTQG